VYNKLPCTGCSRWLRLSRQVEISRGWRKNSFPVRNRTTIMISLWNPIFDLQRSHAQTICNQPLASSSETVDPHVKCMAFHFAYITFIIPAGKTDILGLFQWISNYGHKCWKQVMQMAISISEAHVCCRHCNLHTNRNFKTLTMNIFTRASTFRGSAGWLQRQKAINLRTSELLVLLRNTNILLCPESP
jgi:hypothetical protein